MSFSEFYQRSINEPEQFWAEQARRIDWQTPFTQTLDHSNPPFARWFCEGRTNLCHNAIDRWLEKQPEALALIAVSSETEEERTFTFRQLHDEVNAVASMLRSLGVQRGDLLERFKASCLQNLPSRPRFLTFYLIIIPHFAENATIFSKYFFGFMNFCLTSCCCVL